MRCHDCGRERIIYAGAEISQDADGWIVVGEDAFCPSCLRIAVLEKHVQKIEAELGTASKVFKLLLSVLINGKEVTDA